MPIWPQSGISSRIVAQVQVVMGDGRLQANTRLYLIKLIMILGASEFLSGSPSADEAAECLFGLRAEETNGHHRHLLVARGVYGIGPAGILDRGLPGVWRRAKNNASWACFCQRMIDVRGGTARERAGRGQGRCAVEGLLIGSV